MNETGTEQERERKRVAWFKDKFVLFGSHVACWDFGWEETKRSAVKRMPGALALERISLPLAGAHINADAALEGDVQDRPADGGRGPGPRGVRRRSATSGPLGGADVTGRGEEVADEGLPGVHGDGLSTIGRKGPLRDCKGGGKIHQYGRVFHKIPTTSDPTGRKFTLWVPFTVAENFRFWRLMKHKNSATKPKRSPGGPIPENQAPAFGVGIRPLSLSLSIRVQEDRRGPQKRTSWFDRINKKESRRNMFGVNKKVNDRMWSHWK